MAVVTTENETYIRSYHPSLETRGSVLVREEHGFPTVWLIQAEPGMTPADTHVAGREVHYINADCEPPPCNAFGIMFEDPIHRRINSRRVLTTSDVLYIRTRYPKCVGIRLLIAGFVVLLFENRKAIRDSWFSTGIMEEMGCLRLYYAVARYSHTTTAAAVSGQGVVDHPTDSNATSCLGLRLILPTGIKVATTNTHTFVKLSNIRRPLRLRLSDWCIKAINAFPSFRLLKRASDESATREVTLSKANAKYTPIGKQVWVAGSNEKVLKTLAIWHLIYLHAINAGRANFYDLRPSFPGRTPPKFSLRLQS